MSAPEPVRLTWSELTDAGGLAEVADGTLTLVLASDLPYGTEARVGIRVIDGSRALGRDLGRVALPAAGEVSVAVDLTSFDVEFFRLAAPASVGAVAEIPSLDGRSLIRSQTEPTYVHGRMTSADPRLLAYDHETLLARFAGGDLTVGEGRPAPPGRDGFVDGGQGLAADAPITASGNVHTFCLKYRVNVVDYGVGEDFHADGDAWIFFPNYTIVQGLWAAHGARFDLFRPNVPEPTALHASENTGCLSFESEETEGFVIRLYYEFTVGGNTFRVLDEQGNVKFQDIKADPGSHGTHMYFTSGSTGSSTIGIAAWSVRRLTQLFGTEAPTGSVVDILMQPCEAFDGGACYQGGDGNTNPHMEIDQATSRKKFAMAHEVGHWFDDLAFGMIWLDIMMIPGEAPYEFDDPDDKACQFTGTGLHAMRSQERSTYAFKEGIGHFLSALVWNDLAGPDAFFKYYKVEDPVDPEIEHYNNDLFDVAADGPNPPGGVVNWNDNRCGAELQKGFGHSVEGDWLRFFWDYLTDDALGMPPTLAQFASQMRAVDDTQLDEFNVYGQFKSVLSENQDLLSRLTAIADVHGV
ncbi:MAG: hypothetical protein M3144_10280, partial [Actinomycetota bacterium]|nr:hypothetical protein [Actinomycetota bacterium]